MKKHCLILFIISCFSFGCHKDPVIPNEEELITSMIYTLTPMSGGNSISLKFLDPDGDGGIAPAISMGTLSQNTIYLGEIQLLNELVTPIFNITEEIKNENNDHQFFFEPSIGLTITTTYEDKDTNGKPVGLASRLITGNSSSGNLKITLRHKPDKSASGVTDGNIANAGGESDLEIEFPIHVQ